MRRIYMDANATTPLLPEVFEAMRPFWMEHYGNASSIHQQGQHARGAVEQARTTVARFLHCLTSEIVFTSGGTPPTPALAAIAHTAGALFHTDAVQAVGRLPLDLSAEGPLKHIDLLTLSGHKIYAPKGIGALFVRRNVRLTPMLHGGTHER